MVIFVLKRRKVVYDKLFNVKYLPLFHHFKVIYQFPKLVIFLVKIVASASLNDIEECYNCNMTFVLINLNTGNSVSSFCMDE